MLSLGTKLILIKYKLRDQNLTFFKINRKDQTNTLNKVEGSTRPFITYETKSILEIKLRDQLSI